jgi:dimethylglycine catabolism A
MPALVHPVDGHRRLGRARVASDVLTDQIDGDRVKVVGTRMRGGRMYEATQSGFWTAAQI